MPNAPTYEAFMLDHAAGNLSDAMKLAGNLHILLSDTGAEIHDVWRQISEVMGLPSRSFENDIEAACQLIVGSGEAARWKRGLSGAQYAKAGPKGGKLMRLLPGRSVPTHGHRALEVTVVLEGKLQDGHGTYGPGDIVFGEPGMRHKPAADGEQPCVCYVAKTS